MINGIEKDSHPAAAVRCLSVGVLGDIGLREFIVETASATPSIATVASSILLPRITRLCGLVRISLSKGAVN
jgi:hypothetical protein